MCTWISDVLFGIELEEIDFEDDIHHTTFSGPSPLVGNTKHHVKLVTLPKQAQLATVDEVASLIIEAQNNIVFLTGAGISEASDIPTFRNPDHGVWAQHDPRECGTRTAFDKHPEKLWTLLREMVGPENDPKPNAGHIALGHLEEMGYSSTVITQNVDDLHEQAGNSDVVHLHGNLWNTNCVTCGMTGENTHRLLRATRGEDMPPRCKKCPDNGVLKPDAVLFGESLDRDILTRAEKAVTSTSLMIVLGTSARVNPAADLPIVASNNGAKIIEINREMTQLTHTCVDFYLHEALEVVLPAIVSAVRVKKSAARGSLISSVLSGVL
eukprot:CFRG1215T1